MVYLFVIGRSNQVLLDVLVQFIKLEVVLLYFVFILAYLFCEFVEESLSFDCELVEGVGVAI